MNKTSASTNNLDANHLQTLSTTNIIGDQGLLISKSIDSLLFQMNKTDYDEDKVNEIVENNQSNGDMIMDNSFDFSLTFHLWLRHSSSVSLLLCMAYTFVFVLGIIGNCFVVAVVFRTPRMRTVTNYFIVNLAFADILVLLFCLPTTLISNLLIPWIFGIFMCKAVSFLQGVSVCASISTLVAVSVDRYLAICYPLRCQMTRKHARRVILLIWLFSCIIAFPWALYFTLTPIDQSLPEIMLCNEQWPDDTAEITYFVVANLCLCYLIPLVMITSCYIAIWLKVWRRKIPGEASKNVQMEYLLQKSKLKTAKMFVVVVIIFALSWLPLYCIFAIVKLGGTIESNSLQERMLMIMAPVAQWLGASNSCINPILYCFFNKKYRYGFLAILRSKKCCGTLNYEDGTKKSRNQISTRYSTSTREGTRKLKIRADTQCEIINSINGI